MPSYTAQNGAKEKKKKRQLEIHQNVILCVSASPSLPIQIDISSLQTSLPLTCSQVARRGSRLFHLSIPLPAFSFSPFSSSSTLGLFE